MAAVTAGAEAGKTGVPHGDTLIAFAEAAVAYGAPGGENPAAAAALDVARQTVLDALGPAALVDAGAVVGLFEGMDRVADATGTPVEEFMVERSAGMRSELGIDAFNATKDALDGEE
jgi:hypothetical protein